MQYCCGNTDVLHELSFSEANEINGYSPRLAERCYVYRKDELGVLTVELEYVD